MERLMEASQRAINTLRVVNALTPNAQIQGAIDELNYALKEEVKQQADYAALVQAAREVLRSSTERTRELDILAAQLPSESS